MKKSYYRVIFFVAGLGLIYGQACSDVRLVPPQVEQPVITASLKGQFCSTPPLADGDILNVIFVVDMSGSNIEYPTDETGKRLDAIDQFTNMGCIDASQTARFTVLGFSDQVFGTCTAESLVPAAQTATQVAALRTIQQRNLAQFKAGQPPTEMTQTHYLKGIDCALGIIADHYGKATQVQRKKNGYLVFFLTDGVPTDFGTPSFQNNQRVKDALKIKIGDMAKYGRASAGFRLQPIFYGATELARVQPGWVPLAEDMIETLATLGESISRTVDQVSETLFCELLKSGRKIKYVVREFGILNLTARMKNGLLHADSDMDGLLDKDEAPLGFDPARSRSSGAVALLDGLCPQGMPVASCPKMTACSKPNAMGLSDCDVGALGLTDGLDTDRDDLPDAVEILKGGSANTFDLMKNLDGDSLPLVEEILRYGRDPNSPDDNAREEQLLDYSHQLSEVPLGDCPANQESWSFEANYIPLVETVETFPEDNISRYSSHLKHQAGENVVLIYYIVGRSNENPAELPERHLYGKYVVISKKNRTLDLATGFKKLGIINSEFVSQF